MLLVLDVGNTNIVLGAFDVARSIWPGWGTVLTGAFGFQVPEAPEWVRSQYDVAPSPWSELLPLLGWAAGGFAMSGSFSAQDFELPQGRLIYYLAPCIGV